MIPRLGCQSPLNVLPLPTLRDIAEYLVSESGMVISISRDLPMLVNETVSYFDDWFSKDYEFL